MTGCRPGPAQVATRGVILKHVAVYSQLAPPRPMLQAMMAHWSEGDRRQFAVDAESRRDEFWARLGNLREELSPWEREYSRTTMLTMSARQQIDASWRTEAFQILLWALGLVDNVPPYDVEVEHDLLKAFPPDRSEIFVAQARLRPEEILDAARDVAELWHWRSRTRQLVQAGDVFPQSKELHSYDDVVRAAAAHAHQNGDIPSVIDGDFPACGKAYRDLSEGEWSKVTSISIERHFALNWICGYSPDGLWDDTPTDT